MKRYIILLLLIPGWVSAQNRQIVVASSGEDLSQKASARMQFLFPEFTQGDVYYNGYKGNGKLNYNMLLGEMQFLENNQVLALANVKDVIVVNISNRKFYPFNDKEFTEELMSTGNYHLRVRRKGNAAQYSKKGAYGTTSSTSSITSYSSIVSDGRQFDLSVIEEVLISLNCFYYLVGTNGKHILIKNIKTFTKQFSAYRSHVEEFAKNNNTRFDHEDDLKALLKFCSKLGVENGEALDESIKN